MKALKIGGYIMGKDGTFLLAKFGKKEHLEQLKNGEIYFSAIKKYRNDGTAYRGDYMEGKVPINPDEIKLFDENGIDVWPELNKGLVSVSLSWLGDDDLLMFCATAITEKIMEQTDNNLWKLTAKFKKAIKKFGDYVILIWSNEFMDKIINSEENSDNKLSFDSGLITYRDLADFSDTDIYRRTGSQLDPYFVKGEAYKNQNEWRMILYRQEKLQLNETDGKIIHSTPFKNAMILETNIFLETCGQY